MESSKGSEVDSSVCRWCIYKEIVYSLYCVIGGGDQDQDMTDARPVEGSEGSEVDAKRMKEAASARYVKKI